MSETLRKPPVSKRSWARRCAVQALYEWQLTGQDPAIIIRQFLADQDLSKADQEYFQELVHQTPLRSSDIDTAFAPFLDRPLAQVDPVERAILRVSGYELMQRPDIACRIVINEAVELAKLFGAEQGHRFINGVLDKLAHAVRKAEFSTPP